MALQPNKKKEGKCWKEEKEKNLMSQYKPQKTDLHKAFGMWLI